MKLKLFPLILVLSLSSCSNNNKVINSKVFCFDTLVNITLYEGKEDNVKDIVKIVNDFDKISDNYQTRNVTNVFSINSTNESLNVSDNLYELLKTSFKVNEEGAKYFNPFIGSLSKKWKEALKNKQVLSSDVIESELKKMNESSIEFLDDLKVKRNGEAEIDLGAIAKGYTLDKVKDYLTTNNISHYLVDAGSSSILLGEKVSEDGYFSVGISGLTDAYLNLKNCVISTSSNATQGVEIDGVTYSHIINPLNGSAINLHDAVIVVGDKGYQGDALSTSLVNASIDEIKDIENTLNVKTIVIDDNSIAYKNESLEVKYH